jgi:hypothetical protein
MQILTDSEQAARSQYHVDHPALHAVGGKINDFAKRLLIRMYHGLVDVVTSLGHSFRGSEHFVGGLHVTRNLMVSGQIDVASVSARNTYRQYQAGRNHYCDFHSCAALYMTRLDVKRLET